MEPISELLAVRKEKEESLRNMGIETYPQDRGPYATTDDVENRFGNIDHDELEKNEERVSVAGRIMAFRDFGKSTFLHIQDRKGKIQIYVRKDMLKEPGYDVFKKFDISDIVGVTGRVFKTKTGELTILAETMKLLTKSLRPLPEKWHGLKDVEERYRKRYLDLMVNEKSRRVFEQRARIIEFIRNYFRARDFMEVETPMMQVLPGGAVAKPFITHHNAMGMDLYLRIAPELYLKRLIVGGLERVFEVNRNFRNEGISVRHNPEFTMVEFYMAYVTYEDLMDLTEEMVSSLVQELYGTLDFSNQGLEISFQRPWKRLTVRDAILEYGDVEPHQLDDRELALVYARSIGLDLPAEIGYGKLLMEIFEEVAEHKLIQPTFITAYPTEVSPLSRKSDHDPDIVDRFEFYVAGREMANAFSELNDPID